MTGEEFPYISLQVLTAAFSDREPKASCLSAAAERRDASHWREGRRLTRGNSAAPAVCGGLHSSLNPKGGNPATGFSGDSRRFKMLFFAQLDNWNYLILLVIPIHLPAE